MNVISISTDRNIFSQESGVRKRMIEYGGLFTELHIIIFSKSHETFKQERIAENVWIYPTRSSSKAFYMRGAFKQAKRIIQDRKFSTGTTVVTAQDPFETGNVALK